MLCMLRRPWKSRCLWTPFHTRRLATQESEGLLSMSALGVSEQSLPLVSMRGSTAHHFHSRPWHSRSFASKLMLAHGSGLKLGLSLFDGQVGLDEDATGPHLSLY